MSPGNQGQNAIPEHGVWCIPSQWGDGHPTRSTRGGKLILGGKEENLRFFMYEMQIYIDYLYR